MMNERRYLPLRAEVQRFIGLARELNRRSTDGRLQATPAGTAALDETVAALHASLDRMVAVAGKTQEEVDAARSSPDAPPARIEA